MRIDTSDKGDDYAICCDEKTQSRVGWDHGPFCVGTDKKRYPPTPMLSCPEDCFEEHYGGVMVCFYEYGAPPDD